ncbi:MAG: hypothetical protein AAFY25_06800 [Pseudomonadota bacterium]
MVKRLIFALPLLLLGWILVLAVVMRTGGEAPGAFVPWPSAAFISELPDDVSITSRSAISMTLRGDGADLTKRLYAAGAVLVLPAGLDACIPNFLAQPLTGA